MRTTILLFVLGLSGCFGGSDPPPPWPTAGQDDYCNACKAACDWQGGNMVCYGGTPSRGGAMQAVGASPTDREMAIHGKRQA